MTDNKLEADDPAVGALGVHGLVALMRPDMFAARKQLMREHKAPRAMFKVPDLARGFSAYELNAIGAYDAIDRLGLDSVRDKPVVTYSDYRDLQEEPELLALALKHRWEEQASLQEIQLREARRSSPAYRDFTEDEAGALAEIVVPVSDGPLTEEATYLSADTYSRRLGLCTLTAYS